MDVKINIPDWLKIPLYILLPSAWIFGGLVLFLPNKILKKINILSWRNENGFVIGILFLVVTCLLIIYILYFLMVFIKRFYLNLTRNRRTMKKICQMNDMEQAIILKMYNMPGYTMEIDFNHPITKALLARNYVYIGNNQIVSMDVYTNEVLAKVTLQPFVYQALDLLKEKMKRKILKKESKIKRVKNIEKRQQKNEELRRMKRTFEEMFGKLC